MTLCASPGGPISFRLLAPVVNVGSTGRKLSERYASTVPDPDAQEDMDLTNAKRAARNTDGVVFYKVWNGRKKPKMTAQKDNLTKEQVWAVVSYVQSLRKTTTP